jgi:F-type H+-transporting ATPase subunit epsilon
MRLGVYTIEKALYEGEVDELIAKTSTGEISVLANHIPLISRLVKAPLTIVTSGGERTTISINSGFLEVQPENSIVVLVDTH